MYVTQICNFNVTIAITYITNLVLFTTLKMIQNVTNCTLNKGDDDDFFCHCRTESSSNNCYEFIRSISV